MEIFKMTLILLIINTADGKTIPSGEMNKMKRSISWSTFFGGGTNSTNTTDEASNDVIINGTSSSILKTNNTYPIWQVYNFNGMWYLFPISQTVATTSNGLTTNNNEYSYYQPQISPISNEEYSNLPIVPENSIDTNVSTNIDLPNEIITLAKSFGLNDVSALPPMNEIMNTLGTTTNDETIRVIKEIIGTDEGKQLIKKFFVNVDDADDEQEQEDNQTEASEIIEENRTFISSNSPLTSNSPVTNNSPLTSNIPLTTIPTKYFLPYNQQLYTPSTYTTYHHQHNSQYVPSYQYQPYQQNPTYKQQYYFTTLYPSTSQLPKVSTINQPSILSEISSTLDRANTNLDILKEVIPRPNENTTILDRFKTWRNFLTKPDNVELPIPNKESNVNYQQPQSEQIVKPEKYYDNSDFTKYPYYYDSNTGTLQYYPEYLKQTLQQEKIQSPDSSKFPNYYDTNSGSNAQYNSEYFKPTFEQGKIESPDSTKHTNYYDPNSGSNTETLHYQSEYLKPTLEQGKIKFPDSTKFSNYYDSISGNYPETIQYQSDYLKPKMQQDEIESLNNSEKKPIDKHLPSYQLIPEQIIYPSYIHDTIKFPYYYDTLTGTNVPTYSQDHTSQDDQIDSNYNREIFSKMYPQVYPNKFTRNYVEESNKYQNQQHYKDIENDNKYPNFADLPLNGESVYENSSPLQNSYGTPTSLPNTDELDKIKDLIKIDIRSNSIPNGSTGDYKKDNSEIDLDVGASENIDSVVNVKAPVIVDEINNVKVSDEPKRNSPPNTYSSSKVRSIDANSLKLMTLAVNNNNKIR